MPHWEEGLGEGSVADAEGLCEVDGDAVRDAEGVGPVVTVLVELPDGVPVCEAVPVADLEVVPDGVPDKEGVLVWEAWPVEDVVAVLENEAVPVADAVLVTEAVSVTVAVRL